MRLFVAVPLTDDTRHRIAHVVGEAVPRSFPGRPVRPENWHLTVRFLGEVEDVGRDRVAAALDSADLGRSFRIRWGGLGAFRRAARATVLWLGVDEGAAELDVLAGVVEEALESAGWPPDDRPFQSHLTLSRIRPHQDVRSLLEAVDPLGFEMEVGRVVLHRSHLGRGGARYEEIEEFPLG